MNCHSKHNAGLIIEDWWKKFPEWLRKAYHNDPIVHRVVIESAINAISYTDMILAMCKALLDLKNDTHNQLKDIINRSTINLIIPKNPEEIVP